MLSVIVIARNEAHNIRRCLDSVGFAREIIVLDSGSTDNTVEIAKEYTDQVYLTDWQGYGIQKKRALAHARNDWVLNLDADESVDEHLQAAILKAIESGQADAYRIPIRMCFYGQIMRFSYSPTRHIRLFKRAHATYSDDIVHEKVMLQPGSRVGRLHHPIMHHSFQDVSHMLAKMNRYSSYSAKIRLNELESGSLLQSIISSWWMFCRCYLIQLGFLDGKAGFILAMFNAQSSFYRGIKQVYPDQHLDELP